MGEGYNTGDDVAYEMMGLLFIAMVLGTTPQFMEMVPLPTWVTYTISCSTALLISLISQGRLFWAFFGGLGWVLIKTGIIKPDETELIIEYDETGWPTKIEEKKPEEST